MDTACSHLLMGMRLMSNNIIRPSWLSIIWVIESRKRRQVVFHLRTSFRGAAASQHSVQERRWRCAKIKS